MEDLNALRQTLRERLRECYENRKAFWEQLDPLDLIAYAEEIYASQVILENLPDALSEEEIRFLMRYEDPLEIARDYWISAYGSDTVMDEDLRQMMWNLIDRETVSPLYTRNEPDEPEMTM